MARRRIKMVTQHEGVEANSHDQKPVDLDDAPLTTEELTNLRPAREVLPETFFKAVKNERELGNHSNQVGCAAVKPESW